MGGRQAEKRPHTGLIERPTHTHNTVKVYDAQTHARLRRRPVQLGAVMHREYMESFPDTITVGLPSPFSQMCHQAVCFNRGIKKKGLLPHAVQEISLVLLCLCRVDVQRYRGLFCLPDRGAFNLPHPSPPLPTLCIAERMRIRLSQIPAATFLN